MHENVQILRPTEHNVFLWTLDTVHLLIYETCFFYNYMTAFITQQLL